MQCPLHNLPYLSHIDAQGLSRMFFFFKFQSFNFYVDIVHNTGILTEPDT